MNNIKCLNGFQLKMIAIITMTIDHVGAIIFPGYSEMRIIGRLAFPIFAFLIVEGMIHTKDAKKYLVRLGLFALISEIPFNLAFYRKVIYLDNQNVFFTLFLGAACIYVWKNMINRWTGFLYIYFLAMGAELLSTDYGMLGVWMILGLYFARGKQMATLAVLVLINVLLFGSIQSYAVLAFLPIMLYNGRRGYGMKIFFYVYYPVHLLLLYGILMYII